MTDYILPPEAHRFALINCKVTLQQCLYAALTDDELQSLLNRKQYLAYWEGLAERLQNPVTSSEGYLGSEGLAYWNDLKRLMDDARKFLGRDRQKLLTGGTKFPEEVKKKMREARLDDRVHELLSQFERMQEDKIYFADPDGFFGDLRIMEEVLEQLLPVLKGRAQINRMFPSEEMQYQHSFFERIYEGLRGHTELALEEVEVKRPILPPQIKGLWGSGPRGKQIDALIAKNWAK